MIDKRNSLILKFVIKRNVINKTKTMKKKAYMTPEISPLVMETAALIAYSGGSEDVNVDPDPDTNPDDNRSRGLWDISDEEW